MFEDEAYWRPFRKGRDEGRQSCANAIKRWTRWKKVCFKKWESTCYISHWSLVQPLSREYVREEAGVRPCFRIRSTPYEAANRSVQVKRLRVGVQAPLFNGEERSSGLIICQWRDKHTLTPARGRRNLPRRMNDARARSPKSLKQADNCPRNRSKRQQTTTNRLHCSVIATYLNVTTCAGTWLLCAHRALQSSSGRCNRHVLDCAPGVCVRAI